MVYNPVNWSNITNMGELMAIPNANTGGWFWVAMQMMVWFVMLILFINFGLESAALTASFISLILGIFLLYLGLATAKWAVLWPIAVILMVIIYISWSSRSDSY